MRHALRISASALALLLAPSSARAADLCADLPAPLYVTGGGRVLLETLSKALAGEGRTLVYKQQGSCLARDAILTGDPLVNGANGKGAVFWDAGQEIECDLASEPPPSADVGVSDVFPESCGGLPNGLPAQVADFLGPVEAYAFVAPVGSKETSLSRAAAYSIFGFGSDSGVEPWVDPDFLFKRDVGSGTQQMLAIAIGVPADKWQGTPATSSTDLVAKVSSVAAADRNKTLGILTTEVAGEHRTEVKVLAYRDDDQACGYWPDSTISSFDKRSVRDGHYTIWGPLHFLTRVDAKQFPVDDAARDLIDYATGAQDVPAGVDLVAVLANVGLVPQCAMRVSRTTELGPLASFAPNRSCGCYYEFHAGSVDRADCEECESDADCPAEAPRCNVFGGMGFCEVQ